MAAIRRPLPLITARIEFSVEPLPSTHIITQRIDFASAPSPFQKESSPDSLVEPIIELDSDSTLSWIDFDDEDAEMEDGEEKDDEDESELDIRKPIVKKIAKPVGEAGRPNCGGYNLEKKLKWEKETFDEIRVSFFHRFLRTDLTRFIRTLSMV